MHQSFREGFEKVAALNPYAQHYLRMGGLYAAHGAGVGAALSDKGNRSSGALKGGLVGLAAGGAHAATEYGLTEAVMRNGRLLKLLGDNPVIGSTIMHSLPLTAAAASGILAHKALKD
jgi:hypothetical protein